MPHLKPRTPRWYLSLWKARLEGYRKEKPFPLPNETRDERLQWATFEDYRKELLGDFTKALDMLDKYLPQDE